MYIGPAMKKVQSQQFWLHEDGGGRGASPQVTSGLVFARHNRLDARSSQVAR